MQRALRSFLCGLLLAAPAFAAGSPGTCSMRARQGMKAASCCGAVCHCNAGRQAGGDARPWCAAACAAGHGDAKAAPAAGTLVRSTVESLADPTAAAPIHPAAAQSPVLDTASRHVCAPGASAVPRLQQHPFDLLCILRI